MEKSYALIGHTMLFNWFYFFFLYIKESIMETKHKKADTSDEEEINLIKKKSNNY